MFSEGVHSHLRFCLDHLSCVEMGPFSFIYSWVNRELRWVGDDSYVIFGQKFSGEKLSARQYVVMQEPVLLSSKFWAKSSHIFT
jgi:hypothetical protein